VKRSGGIAATMPGAAWLLTSPHVLAKLIRFGVIGVCSGAIYALVMIVLVSGLGAAPVPASIAGYCASVPLNFVGHRRFSFRSNGHWTGEAVRFVLAQAVNIAVIAASTHLVVNVWHLSYGWGMLGAVIVVPIANFLFMNLWVFAQKAGPERGSRGKPT
jgi:putative flippase GtrA